MGVPPEGPVEIVGQAVIDRPDEPVDGGDKGFHGGGVVLGQGMGAVDAIVHHHQCASVGCLGVGGHGHGVVKVEGAVGADGGKGTHGPGEHYRPLAAYGQVEKIGRLLHGVGAVGDHHTVDVSGFKEGVDALGQPAHDRQGHVLGSHIGNLLALYPGEGPDFGYGIEHGRDVDLPRRISGLGGRGRRTGNGSAGGEHHHAWQDGVGWMGGWHGG
ncbi:hypothetical protein DESC_780332 [Desulfosarcina cetonica]|nr:hypothetical protein DESC_780332 [Desulfosarcina cetonica]